MKVLQLAALVGGAAFAVSTSAVPDGADVVISAEAWTTSTIYTTSVFTVTQCGPGVTNCPEDGTAIVTSVVAVTTTVCPVTAISTLSAPITASASSQSSVISASMGPTSVFSSVVSSTAAPSGLSSTALDSTGSAAISIKPPPTPSTSVKPSSSSFSVAPSSRYPSSSALNTDKSSIATPSSIFGSFTVAPSSNTVSSSLSSTSTHSSFTDATFISYKSLSSGGYILPSSATSVTSASHAATNTDAVPTSFKPSLSSVIFSSGLINTGSVPTSIGSSSSSNVVFSSAVPSETSPSSSVNVGIPEYPSFTVPPSLTSQNPTEPAHTHTTVFNSTIEEGITRITNVLTGTLTSVIIGSNSQPLGTTIVTTIQTTVQDKPNSSGTSISGRPSVSGYPNISMNGTIVYPTPTSTPLPINNLGHKVLGVGKSSMVAIIVAFAFAPLA